MMSQPEPVVRHPRSIRPLLSSCAMGLALAALGHSGAASAQVHAIQGTGAVDAGLASIDNAGGTTSAPRTNVRIDSPNAVINWTPSDTAAGTTPIDFLPANGLAYFYSPSDPNFIVLNRVIPATTRQIGLNGQVQSVIDISGTTSPGGNVWFYSPTGFVAGTGSRFSTNGLILTANDIPYTPGSSGGGINFGSNGEIQFTAAAGSQANVTLLPGARVSNTSDDAYTLIVAPSIVQGGTIELDGSVGLIAAESVSIIIQNSLFDINVQVGTSVANAIVHTGSTGAGATGDTLAGPQHTIVMATPQNTAITMLLGGSLGATSVNASAADRSVVLSGGYDYNDLTAGGLAAAPDVATPVNVQIGTTDFNADLTALTTGSIVGNPSRGTAINFLGNASLTAGTTASLTADLDETITASGDLLLQAPVAAVLKLGTTNIEAGAVDNAAIVNILGDLTVSADSPNFTPGADGTGGTATISLESGTVGPQLTVSGSTVVTALGLGAEGPVNGGSGFGGTAEIAMNGGTLSLGDTIIQADGYGSEARSSGLGGNGAGGTARLLASGGTSTLTGLTITARGVGEAGLNGNGNADNSAGLAQLVATGAGTQVQADSLTISADASVRVAEAPSSSALAGTVDVRADAGGLLAINGALNATAVGEWLIIDNPPHTTVGLTRGGSVSVTANGGTLNADGAFLDAGAAAIDSPGAQGDAIGGTVTVRALDLAGNEGAITFANGLSALASGIGAAGASGGNGLGGAVSLLADGGTIDLGTGQSRLEARGRAGFVPDPSISGTGGTVSVLTNAGGSQAGLTFVSLNIDASGSANYIDIDVGPVGAGDGALGQGGAINITSTGGTLQGSSISANASGTGAYAGSGTDPAALATGGTGQGGSFDLLVNGGTVDLLTLNVLATGTGGFAVDADVATFAGNPGQGLGGTATITATSGTFGAQALTLDASGIGGAAGGSGGMGTGSPGGASGQGGTAALNLGGANFTTPSILVRADGRGGNGAPGDETPGGSGTGGLAAVTATDAGSYTLGDLMISANGVAGNNTGIISSADGTGTGGTARFVNQGAMAAAANSRTVGSLVLQANGDGGDVGGLPGQKAVAGFVQLSDLASGANSHARFAGVSMSSVGLTATASSGALLESAGGNATTIDGSLDLGSTGTVTVAVTGNSPVSVGASVSIFSSLGDVLISHAGQGSPLFPTITGGDLFIDAEVNVAAGSGSLLSSNSTMFVRARTGSISADSLAAVDDLSVHALGGVSLTNATTTGTPTVLSDGSLAGGQILITAGLDPIEFVGPYQPVDVTIGGSVNASGQLDIHAGRDILGIGASPLLEGQAVRLVAERDIAGANLAIRSRSDLDWYIGRNLLAGTVDVAGTTDMIDPDGVVLQAGQINVNGDLGIANLILRSPAPALVRAAGNLTIGRAQTTGLDVATPGGVLTVGGLEAYPGGLAGFLTATAPTISLAEIRVSGDIAATASAGSVTTSNLSAGGGITLAAATDITASGLLQGRTVTLAAPGAMSLGTVNVAAGDLIATPGGALSLQNASASGAITLGGTSVTLGNTQAGGVLSVSTPGAFTVNGQASGTAVRVGSGDVVINSGGRIGTAGTTSLVELTNNNAGRRSFYGSAGNPAGYSLSGAEIAQLFGSSITLIAPQTAQSSPTVPDVTIGDMTVTGAQLGSQGTFTVQTAGRVLIGGAVSFTGLASGNTFAVRAGDLILLDNQTGSVDLRGANNTLGGRLDFSANTIMAVSSATRTALAGQTDPTEIDRLLGINDGRINDEGALRADSMFFSVGRGLYIQNTGTGSFFPLRRGFQVGSGGLAVSTSSARTPPLVVINGVATGSGGTDAFGLQAIPLVSINGQPAPSSSGAVAGSTINGCDFTNVDDCRPPLIPEVTLTRDRVQSPVMEQSDAPSDTAVERQSLVTPEIELQDIGRLTYEPLIDEPVTGSGNDDLWLPECDPGAQGNCPEPAEPGDKAP